MPILKFFAYCLSVFKYSVKKCYCYVIAKEMLLLTWCCLMCLIVCCHLRPRCHIFTFYQDDKCEDCFCCVWLGHSWNDVNLMGYYKRMSIKYCTEQNGAVSLSLGQLQVMLYFEEWQIRWEVEVTPEAGEIGYV